MEVFMTLVYVIFLGIVVLIAVDIYLIKERYKKLRKIRKEHGEYNDYDIDRFVGLIGELGCLILALMIFTTLLVIMSNFGG